LNIDSEKECAQYGTILDQNGVHPAPSRRNGGSDAGQTTADDDHIAADQFYWPIHDDFISSLSTRFSPKPKTWPQPT
jgi:hypothetical protein